MCHATVVRTNQTGFYGLLYGDFHMKFALPLPGDGGGDGEEARNHALDIKRNTIML